MRFDLITLFPEMCQPVLDSSILNRAQKAGLLEIAYHDPRQYTKDKHKSVDDTPYGGGAGMVLRVDVYDAVIQAAKAAVSASSEPQPERARVILLSPQGQTLTQAKAAQLAQDYDRLILVTGHYEGFDERIRSLVDEEISIGNYVLTGGELPALVLIDSVARLLPGVLKAESPQEESYSLRDENGQPLIEYPHYTRPLEYKNMKVPEILLSGHHAEIAKWRFQQAKERTAKRDHQAGGDL